MAQLLVRNLDEDLKGLLRERALAHGRSMEEEARAILRAAVVADPSVALPEGLGTRMARRFAHLGLEEPLEELPRGEARPALFDEDE